jgi:hypothetical protein
VLLRVYTKVIDDGCEISITSDNDNIYISPQKIIVRISDAVKNVAEYEVEIWGDSIGAKAIVIAKADTGQDNGMEVKIVEGKEAEKSRGSGIFNEPIFELSEAAPGKRSEYSEEHGRVIIHGNFPGIQRYFGKDCRERKTLAAKILFAEMVAESSFFEIARAKVVKSALLDPAGDVKDAKIQAEALLLFGKYWHKLHEYFVGQDLIDNDRARTELNG